MDFSSKIGEKCTKLLSFLKPENTRKENENDIFSNRDYSKNSDSNINFTAALETLNTQEINDLDLDETANEDTNIIKGYLGSIASLFTDGLNEENIVNALLKSKDTANNTLEFVKSFLATATLASVNESFCPEKINEVKDSEISNTKEFNGLSNQDMVLLSNIAYTDIANIENKGKNLGEIVDEIKINLKNANKEGLFDKNGNITQKGVEELVESGFSTGIDDTEAYAKMLNEISNSEELKSLTILDNADQLENYINATTYGHLDKQGKLIDNPTVIFKGTGNATGWMDNAQSLVDTDTQMQKAANEYIERQQYTLKDYKKDENDVMLSVAGHSKGGNMAMYVTVMNDNISNCLSFDGEGFNREFLEIYDDEIAKNKSKITAVNTYIDPVSSLLNPIAQNTFYVGADITKSPKNSNEYIEMKSFNDLKNVIWDAHSPTTLYKAISQDNEDEHWNIYDKSNFSDTIKEISTTTESIEKSKKQYLSTLLADVFVELLGHNGKVRENDAEKLSEAYTIENHDLTMIKTSKGYNLYCTSADSNNTVATLTPQGELETGILEPYFNGDEEDLYKALKETIENIEQESLI